MSEPFVVVSIPIRNRAWAVPLLFDSLRRQTRPPDEILFVTGDNDDRTAEVIVETFWSYRDDRIDVTLEEFDTGCPAWRRDGSPRYSLDDHANLAVVYNRGIEEALSRWPQMTHLWLLDSDVVPRPDVLELLLEARLEVVSAMVRNSPGALNFMLGMDAEGNPRRTGGEGARAFSMGCPHLVTFLSACTLVERKWLELEVAEPRPLPPWSEVVEEVPAGPSFDAVRVRFAPHPRSHDFPFVRRLELAGARLWVHPKAETAHYFYGPDKGPLLP